MKAEGSDWKMPGLVYGAIEGNRELRTVVDIIYEKIQYYGDAGPRMPNSDEKFVQRYEKDMQEVFRRLDSSLTTESLQALMQDLMRKEQQCHALEEALNHAKGKQQKTDELLRSLRDMLDEVKIDELENMERQLKDQEETALKWKNDANVWQNKYQLLENAKRKEMEDLSRRIHTEAQKTKDDEEREYMVIIDGLKQVLGISDGSDMKAKKEIKRELKDIREKIDKIISQLASEQSRREEAEAQKGQSDTKIQELNDRVRVLEEEKRSIEQKKDDEIRHLEEKNKELVDAQASAGQDLQSKEAKIGQLEREKEASEQGRKTQEETIHNLNTKIGQLEQEKEESAQGRKAQEETIHNLKKNLEEWQRMVEAYTPVRDAMQDCDTFQSLLEERNLTGDSATTLFAFACAIGEQIDFAKAVHDCALAQKKENRAPMTSEEKQVYDALNCCYRKACRLDFDIFVLPDKTMDRPVTEDFAKTAFDKNKMVNLANERDKSSKYATQIYVPMLKAKNGNMSSQSYVQVSQV